MKVTGRIRNPFATSKYLLKRKIEEFNSHIASPVLDIGAGYGQYTTYLRERGHIVDCLEPDTRMRNPRLEYSQNYSRYNTGLLINVLHHVSEDIESFLARYLDLCDTLIIGELNGDSWLVRNYHKLFLKDEIGVHFSKKKFQMMLQDHNVIDFWLQNLGPFVGVHMFGVISKRRIDE
jgi:SAM-dependent methyltransferase